MVSSCQTIAQIVPIIADWCWVDSNEVDAFISSWSSPLVGKSRIDADDDVMRCVVRWKIGRQFDINKKDC